MLMLMMTMVLVVLALMMTMALVLTLMMKMALVLTLMLVMSLVLTLMITINVVLTMMTGIDGKDDNKSMTSAMTLVLRMINDVLFLTMMISILFMYPFIMHYK